MQSQISQYKKQKILKTNHVREYMVCNFMTFPLWKITVRLWNYSLDSDIPRSNDRQKVKVIYHLRLLVTYNDCQDQNPFETDAAHCWQIHMHICNQHSSWHIVDEFIVLLMGLVSREKNSVCYQKREQNTLHLITGYCI